MSLGCRACHPVPRRILWPLTEDAQQAKACSCLADCGNEHCQPEQPAPATTEVSA
jgi:hypothetical protein